MYSNNSRDGLSNISKLLKLPEYETLNNAVGELIAKQNKAKEVFDLTLKDLAFGRLVAKQNEAKQEFDVARVTLDIIQTDDKKFPKSIEKSITNAPFGIQHAGLKLKFKQLNVTKPTVMLAQVLYLQDPIALHRAYKTLNGHANTIYKRLKEMLFPSSPDLGADDRSQQDDLVALPALEDTSEKSEKSGNSDKSEGNSLDSKNEKLRNSLVETDKETEEKDDSTSDCNSEIDDVRLSTEEVEYSSQDSPNLLLNEAFQNARNITKGNLFHPSPPLSVITFTPRFST